MTASIKRLTDELSLKWITENLDEELADAARNQRSPEKLIERLLAGELEAKKARSVATRLTKARIPVIKTLDQFNFAWPKKINADLVRHLFRLKFLEDSVNVVLIGGVGMGKTHLASALAYEACQCGKSVLFTSTVNMVQVLEAARIDGSLKRKLRRYTTPNLLVLDELGYLPVDREGANLLFQVIGTRYEHASTIITTNRVYNEWAPCFNDDHTVTAAVLDRVCHHVETVIIEGKSYRQKNAI
jgi:DNA replication protein DnaC